MFDLDGTLIRYTQEEFIHAYFKELRKVFVRLSLDPDKASKGIWVGTKAMVQNDGSMLNTQRFWNAFSEFMGITGEQLKAVEAACDDFYTNEFNKVKAAAGHSDIPQRLVRNMAARGYYLVLATNPFFPSCAVDSRLEWIGLEQRDFKLTTHYGNSSFCKPNLNYYREVFSKINKSPEQCLMVGNNPAEDMCAGELGSETYLVNEFIENEACLDIAKFRNGTLEELEVYLMSLPKL